MHRFENQHAFKIVSTRLKARPTKNTNNICLFKGAQWVTDVLLTL